MHCAKNGQGVIVGGTFWHADRWVCPGCDHEIVKGFGSDYIMDECNPRWNAFIQAEGAAFGPPLVIDEN